MNKEEQRGRIDKAAGELKEEVGRATNDRALETEGVGDQAKGNVEKSLGEAHNDDEAVEELRDKIKS